MTNKQYHTSDTAEAAYLMNHGIKLIDTDLSLTEVVFTLEQVTEGDIGQLLQEWESFTAPERKFYKTYRWLLSQIKRGSNGNQKS